MRKIAIMCCMSNSVQASYEAEEPNQSAYGGPWGDANQFEHRVIPVDLEDEPLENLFPADVQVQDGTEMVLQGMVDAMDSNGNPILDSEGNVQQIPDYEAVPKMVTVKGFVKI